MTRKKLSTWPNPRGDDDDLLVHGVEHIVYFPPAKDPANEKNPAPVNAPRWRNLYFGKGGVSGLGCTTWPSEKEASKAAEDTIRHWLFMIQCFGRTTMEFANQVIMEFEDYTHTFPIPWNKDD